MNTKYIPLIAAVTAYLLTPWKMNRVELLIWFTLIYMNTREAIQVSRIYIRRIKRKRAVTHRYDYELVGVDADGRPYTVEGSRQR